jgi:hypothetical protein
MERYKKIINAWNYATNYTRMSLPVSDLEHFKCMIATVHSVQAGE